MPHVRRLASRIALAVLVATVGCARIEYRKVPTPTQYGDYWSIDDQRKADNMEGPRYYLPRPYVHLKEPIPVAMRTAFVSLQYVPAEYETVLEAHPTRTTSESVTAARTLEEAASARALSADKRAAADAVAAAKTLASVTSAKGSAAPPATPVAFAPPLDPIRGLNLDSAGRIPAPPAASVWRRRLRDAAHFRVVMPTPAPAWLVRLVPPRVSISEAREFFAKAKDDARLEDAALDGADPKKPEEQKKEAEDASKAVPPSSVTARVGFINKDDPVTHLGPTMDVVYLPDMEEQYVIKRFYGLGTGDLQIALRNGWAAETFGEQVDNSNLIPYVIDQVEHASSAALSVLTDWGVKKKVSQLAGATPIAAGGAAAPAAGARLEDGTLGDAKPSDAGDGDGSDVSALIGKMVVLKVVEVKVAQKGIYPVLKPREIRDWFKLTYEKQRQDAPGSCQDCGDSCGPLGALGANPEVLLEELLRRKNLAWIRPDQVFVPAPPFTMVGFNVITDAYIGTVTKSELGIGTYAAASTADENGKANGSGNTDGVVAALYAKLDKVSTTTPDAAKARGKLDVKRGISVESTQGTNPQPSILIKLLKATEPLANGEGAAFGTYLTGLLEGDPKVTYQPSSTDPVEFIVDLAPGIPVRVKP